MLKVKELNYTSWTIIHYESRENQLKLRRIFEFGGNFWDRGVSVRNFSIVACVSRLGTMATVRTQNYFLCWSKRIRESSELKAFKRGMARWEWPSSSSNGEFFSNYLAEGRRRKPFTKMFLPSLFLFKKKRGNTGGKGKGDAEWQEEL